MKNGNGQDAALPKVNVNMKFRDPWANPAYVAEVKRVLNVVVLTNEETKEVTKTEPEAGTFVVCRAPHTSDVRTGDEICGVLKKLYPKAAFRWAAALMLALAIGAAHGADAVEPSSCTITNMRGEAEVSIPGTYYKSTTLLFTNCVLFSGSTTNTRQGIDGVTVTATISDGTASSSTSVVATAISTNLGTYWFSVNLRTNLSNQANVQIKLTDAQNNTYIYPWKVLNMRSPLQ
jgi:hypothetical protein